MEASTTETRSGKPELSPVLGAVLWMCGTLASFLLMGISGRELSAEFDTFQILFTRSAVGLAVVCAVLSVIGWRYARTQQPWTQVGRNLIHFCGQFGWFFGLSMIPLAQVFAIEFTTPMWTLLIAFVLLGERITPVRVTAVVLGLIGIFVILRPGFETVEVAQLAVVGAAIAYATTYVVTKHLTATDAPVAIMLYMTLIQMPIAVLLPFATHELGLLEGIVGPTTEWVWPSLGLWPWAVLVGVSGLSAHYCLSRALKLADASIVVPLDFLRLPLAAVVGYLAYAEIVDWFVLIGAAIIFAGNFLNVRAENRK